LLFEYNELCSESLTIKILASYCFDSTSDLFLQLVAAMTFKVGTKCCLLGSWDSLTFIIWKQAYITKCFVLNWISTMWQHLSGGHKYLSTGSRKWNLLTCLLYAWTELNWIEYIDHIKIWGGSVTVLICNFLVSLICKTLREVKHQSAVN
jgi:hypothetical protein